MDIHAFRLWIGNLRTSAQFTGTFWATAFTLPTWYAVLAITRRRILAITQCRALLNSRSSRQPPVKELNEYHVAGGFDEQHYAPVTGNKTHQYLAQQILEAHFTESIQEEIADELVLISSKSVNSATRYFAKMYYALITTSARYVVLICATTTPPSRWKRRI